MINIWKHNHNTGIVTVAALSEEHFKTEYPFLVPYLENLKPTGFSLTVHEEVYYSVCEISEGMEISRTFELPEGAK